MIIYISTGNWLNVWVHRQQGNWGEGEPNAQTRMEWCPSGVPVYRAHVENVNPFGFPISDIHLRCGWFSSSVLINPKIFKRLCYNYCLVRNGRPLASGSMVEFEFANSFSYPLSFSSIRLILRFYLNFRIHRIMNILNINKIKIILNL